MVWGSQGIARRLLGDSLINDSKRLSKLLHSGQARRVGWLSNLRSIGLTGVQRFVQRSEFSVQGFVFKALNWGEELRLPCLNAEL